MTITADQRAYYWLNIVGGWIILPIIILTTLLSRRTRKSPLLMNLYYIWTYEALLAALLFVTNKYSLEKDHVLVPRIQDSDPLCIAQAVMFEGASPQMSAANLCVVLNVFLIMRSITRSTTVVNPMVTYALVLYPHLCYLAVLVPFIIIAAKNPGKTSPHQFYCTIDLGYASMLSGVTTVANTILAVSLQTWILVVLRREHRKVFSRTGLNSSIILRVLLFTTIQLIAVILAIITLNDFTAVTPDIMVASSPILVALIFGTQQDVINAWYSLLTTHPLVTLDTWWNASSHSQSGSNSRSHSQSQSQSRSKSQSQSQTQHSRRVRSMSMPDDAPHPTSSRRSGAPRPFKFTPGRSESGLESVVEEINLPTYPPTSASVQKLRPREANNPNDGLMDFFEMMDKSRIPGIPRRSNSAPGHYMKRSPGATRPEDLKHSGILDEDVEAELQGKPDMDLEDDEKKDAVNFSVSLDSPGNTASPTSPIAATGGSQRSSVIDVVSSLSSYRRQHAISFDPALSAPDRNQDRHLDSSLDDGGS